MSDSDLWCWGYYPYWPRHEPGLPDPHAYFVFVEDAKPLPTVDTLDGPDASDFVPDHPALKGGPFRFRTSGILAADFWRWLDRFEELTPETADFERRRVRRITLREFFEEVRLPVIDIYVGRHDDELPALRLTLTPGSWHLAYIRYGEEQPHSRPVYATDGAIGEPAGVRRGGLLHLAPVPPPMELRLRDIFSLNHVPDGDVDPEEGDDSAPFDAPRPGSRPSGSGEAEAWQEVSAGEPWQLQEVEEEEDEAPGERHSYSRKSHHAAQGKRKLIQSQGSGS